MGLFKFPSKPTQKFYRGLSMMRCMCTSPGDVYGIPSPARPRVMGPLTVSILSSSLNMSKQHAFLFARQACHA